MHLRYRRTVMTVCPGTKPNDQDDGSDGVLGVMASSQPADP